MDSRPPFERFYAVRRFEPTLAFTADGAAVLFSCNISGQFNLWRAAVAGSWPEQLTGFTSHTVRAIAVRTSDGLVAFAADGDGDEFHQLYLLERDGWPRRFTDAPKAQHFLNGAAFSPDGSRLAYGANARSPSDLEVWVQAIDGGDPRPVFGEGMFAFAGPWSPDGKQLLAIEARSNSDQSIHLVGADDGTATELTPHVEPAKFDPGPWKQDGSGFYLLTDAGSEFVGLAFYDLAARSWSYVEQPDSDISEVAGSADGRVLAWIENDRGWSRLRIRDLAADRELPAPQLPLGTSSVLGSGLTVSADGRRVALVWEQSRRSQEVYVIETATGEARRLTDSRFGAPPEGALVEPELVAFPTWDDREVPAWLYRAPGEGRRPVVIYIHGGPEAQERPGYQPLLQYLCSRGISVLAPNIRGSTGYGKSYQRLIYGDWGGGDLRDFEAAATWLKAQDWVDDERLGVAGGSYGGFATLSCLARLPELWAVGVDLFGPSNLISLISSAPPTWWRVVLELIGDPETQHDELVARSPLTYADDIRAPLLVIQGAKDPRVVPAESEQLVARLRDLGRPVEYELFEDEGHGFTRYPNVVRAFKLAAEFLERHLVPESSA
jgi:dipeptidyl aminopeptidase/acylaminoacyl peptidase